MRKPFKRLAQGGGRWYLRTQLTALLIIWGKQDPHVPQAARDLIYKRLTDARTNFTWHEFNAEHAFIRDEGYRYNPSLARICYAMAFELFHRKLYLGEQAQVSAATEATH